MGSCDREIFELLIRRGDVAGIQGEISRCLDLALGRLAAELKAEQRMELFNIPLTTLKKYLRDIW